MKKKRYLTSEELNKINIEQDMLKGNINRMCVSDDDNELRRMYFYAQLRIKNIFNICMNKYIDEERSENE